MADFTQTFHRTAYGAISPTNPANSQAGRTVLISGASAGIGLSIAESYALASADTVILLGRRPHVLESAVTTIRDRLSEGSHCSLVTKVCDVSSAESVTACWDSLRDSHTSVDVMVLNVGETGPTRNTDDIIKHFEINVFANLRMLDRFQSQGPANGKVVLNISSGAAHGSPVRAPGRGAYGASKAAFASLLQSNADVVPASELQMINIHPGLIFTDAARQMGMDERSLPWDDASLPGAFCVWASTSQATFLHGRFVWAAWDVNELMERQEEILAVPGMLKIGLQGVEPVDSRKLFDRLRERHAAA